MNISSKEHTHLIWHSSKRALVTLPIFPVPERGLRTCMQTKPAHISHDVFLGRSRQKQQLEGGSKGAHEHVTQPLDLGWERQIKTDKTLVSCGIPEGLIQQCPSTLTSILTSGQQ